ncbi:hydroxyacylglutathione hydrolase [Limnobacter humi]|uniref:Hydroxyacylglutathione hydrolase n=1 Tax=Limnobacter humi TaxID=1778671 RepID=A0ABT1WFJ2_9BURK|nr:hydroxyacylglutathione hydrolase [Limnobacter humi]MCQ8896291.1 hydroxyacylglutathione hydrolase [Limnobacter humi]
MESFKASQASDWVVHGVPAFQDNYLWIIEHTPSRQCLLVDPGSAPDVLAWLRAHHLQCTGILITHHHLDHIGGVEAILATSDGEVPVFGTRTGRIAAVNQAVDDGSIVTWQGLQIRVLGVPGHTRDHLAYAIEQTTAGERLPVPWLFCGDTLFSAGCGRLFEGTPADMFASLQKINQMPEQTLVFCAHEYTESNLRFALSIEPDNPDIQNRMHEVQRVRTANLSTIPTTLRIERQTNLFVRSKNANELRDLRLKKDQF